MRRLAQPNQQLHPGRDPEKERLRQADERALTSGEKTVEQLWREDAHFTRAKVRLAVELIKAYS